MKRYQLIFSVFLGTLLYSILSFYVGPRGVWPMSQLIEQKRRISINLDSLYEINQEMNARLQNLSSDPDTISVYAHELGYISEGEQLIKLAGFSGGINRNLFAGSVVVSDEPKYLPEWLCKLLGIIVGITFFLVYSYMKNVKKK